jgi:hypothetical protein
MLQQLSAGEFYRKISSSLPERHLVKNQHQRAENHRDQ